MAKGKDWWLGRTDEQKQRRQRFEAKGPSQSMDEVREEGRQKRQQAQEEHDAPSTSAQLVGLGIGLLFFVAILVMLLG